MWEPTYALHSHIARLTGTAVVEGERAADLSTDLDEVRRVFAEAAPSIAFLCSPNNPTGMVDDEHVVGETLALARGVDGLLVVDEAYGQFAPWSALGLVGDEVPLVVTRTFSKTWSMAAARLGYLIGPSDRGGRARQGRAALPPRHGQAAGRHPRARAPDEMQARVAHLVEERGRLAAAPRRAAGARVAVGRQLRAVPAPRRAPVATCGRPLLDRSVLVRNFSTVPRLEGCLRVTVGTPDEDDAFLDALTEILTGR